MADYTITRTVAANVAVIAGQVLASRPPRAYWKAAASLRRQAARWEAYFAAETHCVSMTIPASAFGAVEGGLVQAALRRSA